MIHSPALAGLSAEARAARIVGQIPAYYSEAMAAGFTAEEAGALGPRFAELNRRLEADAAAVEAHYTKVNAELKGEGAEPPNFASRALRCFHCEMPAGFGVEESIASWGA